MRLRDNLAFWSTSVGSSTVGNPPEAVRAATDKLRDKMNAYGPLLECLEFASHHSGKKDDIKALAKELMSFEPSAKALKGALERAAEAQGVQIRRTSITENGEKFPAWGGVRIVQVD